MKKINPNLLKLAHLTYNPELKPREEKTEEVKEEPGVLEIRAKINRKEYIQIPNTTILISKEEINKGRNWRSTHEALAEDVLFMPSPAIFMPYFKNVLDAYHKKKTLYDGDGNAVPLKEVEDIYEYLTSDHRKGCWSWLDAKFLKGKKGLELETEHRVVKGTLVGKTYPLEEYVEEDCFVDLECNTQGLPFRKTVNQSYKQGENIKFWYPKADRVAWFVADSYGAYLNCYGVPTDADSALGVFACAEGARQK